MSSKPAAPSDSGLDRAAVGVRNAALRLAFGVTGLLRGRRGARLGRDLPGAPACREHARQDATAAQPCPGARRRHPVCLVDRRRSRALDVGDQQSASADHGADTALFPVFLRAPPRRTGPRHPPSPDLGRVASDRRRALAGRRGRIREDAGGGRLRCAAHCLGGTRGVPRPRGRGGRGDARHRHLIG